jgi:hypothetical protein
MALIPLLPDDSYGLYMKSIRAEKVDNDPVAATFLAERALVMAEGSMARRLEQRLERLGQRLTGSVDKG